MRNWLVAGLVGLGSVLGAAAAAAQEKQPEPKPAVPPTEIKEDEGPIADPNVPDNLLARLPPERTAGAPRHRYDKGDYPTEIVKRPLTLAAEQVQVSLDVPFIAHDGSPTLTQILRGSFGVTRDWQVGLTYGFGLQRFKPATGEDGYVSGKAFSVETAYTIIPQLVAAEISFAFLADPDLFGMSIAFGVPFKIELGDRWAIFGGRNLVRVKLKGIPVDPADPEANLAEMTRLALGTRSTDGRLQIDLGAAFQARPDVAIFGTFGVGWPDFSTEGQPWSLFAGASYTAARRWDFGGRIGFWDLGHTAESFGLSVFAAVRI